MNKTKEEVNDLLRRVYEMEETMAGELLELCCDKIPISGVTEQAGQAIAGYLGVMRSDTARHKDIVKELLAKYK